MNNTIIDNVKLMYYKNLQKQGKFDEYLKKNERNIRPLTIFLVKQDFASFIVLDSKLKYQILKQNKFDISNLNVEAKAKIAVALINAGYTNILNEVDFHIGDNKKEFYDELMRRCTKNESYYKLFIDLLSEEELLDAIIEDNNFFLYVPNEKKSEIKRKLLDKNPSILKEFPKEEQIELILNNPSLISQVDQDIVIEALKENPSLISMLSEKDIEKYIMIPEIRKSLPKDIILSIDLADNSADKGHIGTLVALDDLNNVKLLNMFQNDITYNFNDILEASKSMSDNELIKFILQSKGYNLSATDHLSSIRFHNNYSGEVKNKYDLFNKLSQNQISMLIQVDSNYILDCIDVNDIDKSKTKVIEIFKNMYGESAFNKLSSSFDNVFNNWHHWRENSNSRVGGEFPAEELKLLFNDKILKTCPGEILIGYFDKLDKGMDVSEDFKKIIELTYGERARKILDSRPKLNVHSINSLEVFDERILNTFGEAFVHNCITYNMYDFSGFLEIIKNPERLELFKYYYDIVCKVYGENVETMQRCISEFSFNEELLRNIKDIDLTEEQSKNLINVLASAKNLFDIKTLEDLDNFDIIANENLKETMLWCRGKDEKFTKDLLCSNLFGLRFSEEKYDSEQFYYGDSIEKLLSLYDFTDQTGYTEDEIKIISMLNFIKNEKDPNKIIEFIDECLDKGTLDTRFYLEVNQVISKVAEKEYEKLSSKITTIEKLDEMCEAEKDKPIEERTIHEEIIDGVKHIYLEGADFNFFIHRTGKKKLEDILTYEGQAGNLAVCTSFVSSTITDAKKIVSKIEALSSGTNLIYAPSSAKQFISFADSDAGTDHFSKHTKMAGTVKHSISNIEKLTTSNSAHSEVAAYRVERDNKNISNENAGGKVYPIAIAGVGDPELCRKHNIAVLHFNAEKYKKKTEKPDLTTGLEEPVLESTGRSL